MYLTKVQFDADIYFYKIKRKLVLLLMKKQHTNKAKRRYIVLLWSTDPFLNLFNLDSNSVKIHSIILKGYGLEDRYIEYEYIVFIFLHANCQRNFMLTNW